MKNYLIFHFLRSLVGDEFLALFHGCNVVILVQNLDFKIENRIKQRPIWIRWFQIVLVLQDWCCLYERGVSSCLWLHCAFGMQFIFDLPRGENAILSWNCHRQITRHCNRWCRTAVSKTDGCRYCGPGLYSQRDIKLCSNCFGKREIQHWTE